MNKDVQRLSQLVMTFGPGAMMDLPTRSVLIGGLEKWRMEQNTWDPIIEERLALKLQNKLRENQRFPADARLTLRTPPKLSTQPGAPHDPVEAVVFPTWFVTEAEDVAAAGGRARHRRRRMVKWSELETPQKRKWRNEAGKAMEVTPIRFVAACKKGHIEDIDWRWVVHADGARCRDPMYLQEFGTSADSRSTVVQCDCGANITFEQAFRKGRLGPCHGRRPWLGRDDADESCRETLDLLTRTATNTYFAQTATSISLPTPSDAIAKAIHPFIDELAIVQRVEDLANARAYNQRFAVAAASHTDADVFAALMRLREQADADAAVPMKTAEFDILASGAAAIGENTAGSRLYAETLKRGAWEGAGRRWPEIDKVVAVHRLREVTCLYGFTRFEPAPPDFGDDLEEISIAVEGAAISLEQTWLPAIEQFGEGIFVQFDESWVREWLSRPETRERVLKLEAGADRYSGVQIRYPGHTYVMLHTISHALLSELALECGYPASSVKERVYAAGRDVGAPTKCGILIYTAATGAQGTLGGLVALAPQISRILEAALVKMSLCSNDPVCADHDPSRGARERSLLGAACHSCLLLAETSCESRNSFLDRSLVIETLADLGSSAFDEVARLT